MMGARRQPGARPLTVADLKRAAATWGATVEDDTVSSDIGLYCCAPRGSKWAVDGVHQLAVSWEEGTPWTKKEKQAAIADAIERMSRGLIACPPDCECLDEDDDDDGT